MKTPNTDSRIAGNRQFRNLVRLHIATYNVGWLVLAFYSVNVPGTDPHYWLIGSWIMIGLTTWLAVAASVRALQYWTAAAVIFATVRSFVYLKESIMAPLGVWLIVLSGISITGLVVLSTNALTGDLEKERVQT